MKDAYKTWTKSFVAGLDFIRAKDDVIRTHPVYSRRVTELFKTLSVEILCLAAEEPKFNFSRITHDSLEDYYDSELSGVPELNFIVETAKRLCASLRVSESFYDIEAQAFCLFVVLRNEPRAIKYLHRLIRPAVMLYRIRDSAHFTGMRGGKPKHKLYKEAMDLAGEYLQRHPEATGPNVARDVRNKLLVNFDSPPAEETIRKWLRNF